VDGATAATHDSLRGIDGCFERTELLARAALRVRLPFQINTLVSQETIGELAGIARLACAWGAARWSLFLLVAVGRGSVLEPISAGTCEMLLQWLADLSLPGLPVITTTEGPHYRRILLEHRPAGAVGKARMPGAGIRDGNGVMFISHTGDIQPSGFLPLVAGNVRNIDPVMVYRESPLFQALRMPDTFSARCGACDYRHLCGGSRARAFAASGDPLGDDPLCLHEPRASRQ
jgi:radical SAM protein with 4Fe4S-binding SPASM domain